MAGKLQVIVGPSGCGKDTLMQGAKRFLPDTVFAKRVITRPHIADAEVFTSVSPATFDELIEQGKFAIHWSANNLRYGISSAIQQPLAAGFNVVFNGSRGALETIRARFTGIQIIWITASPKLLAERISARGRESQADILARLHRRPGSPPPDATVIENNGSIAAGIQALIEALSGQRIALDEIKASINTLTTEAQIGHG